MKAVEKQDGSPHQDQRGRHEPKIKTAEYQVELVKKHISRLVPRSIQVFNVARRKTLKNWDGPGNEASISVHPTTIREPISGMYTLYKDECAAAEDPTEPVSEWVYRKVFNEEFNLSFGRYVYVLTNSHTCTHTHTHSYSHILKHAHTQTRTLTLILTLIFLSISSSYCNRTSIIFELKVRISLREDTALAKSSNDIEMWHEGVTSRGSEEVGSCLLHRLCQLSSSTAQR